jgi:hypothetical protein
MDENLVGSDWNFKNNNGWYVEIRSIKKKNKERW